MTPAVPTVEKLAGEAQRPALAAVLAELSRDHCRDMTIHATKVASAIAMGRSMARQDPEIMEKLGTGLLRQGKNRLVRGLRALRGSGDDVAEAAAVQVTPGLARTQPAIIPKTQAPSSGRVSGFEATVPPTQSRAPAQAVNVGGTPAPAPRPQGPAPQPKPSAAGADIPLDPDVTPSMIAFAKQPRGAGLKRPTGYKPSEVAAADPARIRPEYMTSGSQASATPPAMQRLERALAEGGEDALRMQAFQNAQRAATALPGAQGGSLIARAPTKNPIRVQPLKPVSEVADAPMGLDFMRMVDAGIDPARAEMLMQTSRRMAQPHLSSSLNPTILKSSHDLRAYLQMMRVKTAGAGNPTAEGIGSVVKVGTGDMIKGSNAAARRKSGKVPHLFEKTAIGAVPPQSMQQSGLMHDMDAMTMAGLGGTAGAGLTTGAAALAGIKSGKGVLGTLKHGLKFGVPGAIAGIGLGLGAAALHKRHRQRQSQQYRAGVGSNQSYWRSSQM